MSESVIVVYNPVCGDSTAEQFFNTHVIPRLHAAKRIPAEIICTRSPGDAGVRVLDFITRHKADLTVVVGSGDGTLHEIVNHLAFESTNSKFPIHFVLVPCGTANALYASLFRPTPQEDTVSYKLRSLEVFLGGSSTPRPLTLSLTSILGPHDSDQDYRLNDPRPIASIVVASTALHAAILKDSETLRQQIPGIERFKVAAQQNITKWYASRVKLFPAPSSGVVHIYDPRKGDFIPTSDSSGAYSVLGPFAYFLSTVNVDRLEPEFRINPTISKNPPADASMDVVVVRPQRDPTFTLDTPQAREEFAQKIVAVLTTAYQDGQHINLRYLENGDITESAGGNTVLECFRCGGWEWIPDETDDDAHLLCADGAIFGIERGGRAICMTGQRFCQRTDTTSLRNFYVHV